MSETMLRLENVDKYYGAIGTGVHAVKNITMEVEKGDIIALLGSSGCGKTSTLRMVAGFEETSRGKIHLAGREVQKLRPVRRNVAMAFEGYSLYPTVTVGENIAFALKATNLSAGEVAKKVAEISEMLEIDDDVVALGDGLGGEDTVLRSICPIEGDGVLHDIAVIGDKVKWNPIVVLIDDGDFEVSSH